VGETRIRGFAAPALAGCAPYRASSLTVTCGPKGVKKGLRGAGSSPSRRGRDRIAPSSSCIGQLAELGVEEQEPQAIGRGEASQKADTSTPHGTPPP
jgi:hypothetical protein